MLSRVHRLRHREDFRRVVQSGLRSGRPALVTHLYLSEGRREQGEDGDQMAPARVGFAVSRAVGGAVVRNRARRRLRHLARERVGLLPAGSLLVVRALPPAAGLSSAELAPQLDSALSTVLRRARATGRCG